MLGGDGDQVCVCVWVVCLCVKLLLGESLNLPLYCLLYFPLEQFYIKQLYICLQILKKLNQHNSDVKSSACAAGGREKGNVCDHHKDAF